jgi:hypothetical protein
MGSPINRSAGLLVTSILLSGCIPIAAGSRTSGGVASLFPGLEQSLGTTKGRETPNRQPQSASALVRGKIEPAEGVSSSVPEYITALDHGKSIELNSILKADLDGSSAGLARLERARLAHIQGNYPGSIDEFKAAIELAQDFDDRATVSLSAISDQVTSLFYNDSVIDYEPAGFERVMMYHFQALNYLAKGDLDATAVEVRRANDEQERALKAHEKELIEAQRESSSKGVAWADVSQDVAAALGNSKAVGNAVKNSFQNAYTFYMSGVVHELLNEPNDAYIDYKKALEIADKNGFVQRDVARLAQQLAMTDDIARYSKIFPKAFKSLPPSGSGQVDVVVMFEDGLIPEKKAIKLALPVPGAVGLTAFAIPTYQVSLVPPQPLVVREGRNQIGKTERICALDSLAVKDFEEKAPAMLVRQVLRTAAKGATTAAAGHYGGHLGSLASSAYAVATEKADTRSWRSLPQNAQLLRTQVNPGTTLELVHPNTGAQGSVSVPQGSKTLVIRAIRIGSKLLLNSARF